MVGTTRYGSANLAAMAVHYFSAASLDGFVATDDHSLDWLLGRDVDPDGPHGYTAFLEGCGALAMGASTYEWLCENSVEAGEPWAYAQPTWVFTHRTPAPVAGADLRFVSGPPAEHIDAMRLAAGGRDIWLMGGGTLAAQFADADLIDELWVQLAPVTLGQGRPLLPTRLELELVEVVRNGAFACTHYRVVRPEG